MCKLYVAGIDLSLASTGVATFDGDTIYTDLVKSKSAPDITTKDGKRVESVARRDKRLHDIVEGIWEAVTGGWSEVVEDDGSTIIPESLPALVVIEAPAYGSKYGSQHDRSGLWWRVANLILGFDIPLAAVSPNGRAKYATGKGNASKDEVLSAAIRRYTDADITNNNVADAVVLCAMGVRYLGGAGMDPRFMDYGLPEKNLEAMAGAEWPA